MDYYAEFRPTVRFKDPNNPTPDEQAEVWRQFEAFKQRAKRKEASKSRYAAMPQTARDEELARKRVNERYSRSNETDVTREQRLAKRRMENLSDERRERVAAGNRERQRRFRERQYARERELAEEERMEALMEAMPDDYDPDKDPALSSQPAAVPVAPQHQSLPEGAWINLGTGLPVTTESNE